MFVHDVGSGIPVVLLHGFGLDHRSLLPLEPVFGDSWRRLYFDLPGAARTPAGAIGSSQHVADATVEEIAARLGDEPFAIVGNSFGGMIARYVAHELRPQVLGLATLAGVFVADHSARSVPPRTVLVRDLLLGTDPLLDEYREEAVVESAEGARSFAEYILPGLRDADQAALDRISQSYSLDREPEAAHPEPFVQPSLHITGRQDDVVGYADAWNRVEHYPRATFAVLDGAGHNLLFEQAGVCAALLAEWLGRVEREL